jgi:hypothetical protein
LYWGYIIHIFLGLRPSEIGKLLTTDFVQDGEIWFIDLREESARGESDREPPAKNERRLKTPAAYRRIPIPRLLIDLGLLELKRAAEGAGYERMFPGWHVYRHPKSGREMWGHHLSKSWQYVKTSQKFQREMLSLYSGRHTLAGWYDAMRLPQRIRDRLLGHAPQSVHGEYGPIDITNEEAKTALDTNLKIQLEIADILLTAKLKAEYNLLKAVPLLPPKRK